MYAMSQVSVSPHVLQACDVAGQSLGVMGSLFFAYDLLGRPGGPLRWILRIVIPGTISTAILLIFALVALIIVRPDYGTAVNIVFTLGIFGAILGTFNGIFVPAPGTAGYKRIFSSKDAAVGILVVTCIYAFAEWLGAFFTAPTIGDLYSASITIVLGAVSAGVWRRINQLGRISGRSQRGRPYRVGFLLITLIALLTTVVALYVWRYHDATSVRVAGFVLVCASITCILWFPGKVRTEPSDTGASPDVYSRAGARIGLLAGFGIVFLTVFLFFVFASAVGHLYDVALLSFAFASAVYATASSLGGAVSGGLTQFLFWKINLLPERRMQIIGVFLLLGGFGVQIVQPAFGLLGIPVR